MLEWEPTVNTMVLTAAFCLWYLFLLGRRGLRGNLDLYDMSMLSVIAVVPALFVFVPGLAPLIGALVGVQTPVIVMLGAILIVVFFFLHRMTVIINRLDRRSTLLVQELGLLREEMKHRAED